MEQTKNTKARILLICGVICICAIVAAKVLAADDGNDAGKPSGAKWQYLAFKSKIEPDSPTAEVGKTITKLGRDGWELVGIENHSEAGTTMKTVYYFKRRL
jgi:hypothetical protein